MDRLLQRINDMVWSPYLWMGVAFLSLFYAFWITRKLLVEPFQTALIDFESAPNVCPHLLNAYMTAQKAIEVFKEKGQIDNIKTYEGVMDSYKQKLIDMDCSKFVSAEDAPKVPTK